MGIPTLDRYVFVYFENGYVSVTECGYRKSCFVSTDTFQAMVLLTLLGLVTPYGDIGRVYDIQ